MEESVVFLESGRLDEVLFDFQPFAGKITEFSLRKIMLYGRTVVVLQGSDKFLFERIEIFSGHSSVNELSKVFSSAGILPENAGELAEKIKRYFALLSDGENFRAWGKAMLNRAGTAGRAVMVALPCLLILAMLIRRLYRKGNALHNRDTIFLKAFKRALCWVAPVKRAVSGYFGFLRENRAAKAVWGILWAVQLNLVSIAVSAIFLYTTEEMLSGWAYNCFLRLYTDFRFRRGDNTLLVHLLKSAAAWLWRRNLRIQNKYGYSVLKIEKERGTLDGKPEKKKYFLMNAKIYARRFSTDCFSDYFNDLAKRSGVGLSDYPEYRTEKATVSELKEQNSYFINGLYSKGGR